MNSMSIATHCAMLMNGGQRVAFDKKPSTLIDGPISMVSGGGINAGTIERPADKGLLTRGEESSSEIIKQFIVRDLRERIGGPADFVFDDVLATIEQCENAVQLNAALDDAGDVLVNKLAKY